MRGTFITKVIVVAILNYPSSFVASSLDLLWSASWTLCFQFQVSTHKKKNHFFFLVQVNILCLPCLLLSRKPLLNPKGPWILCLGILVWWTALISVSGFIILLIIILKVYTIIALTATSLVRFGWVLRERVSKREEWNAQNQKKIGKYCVNLCYLFGFAFWKDSWEKRIFIATVETFKAAFILYCLRRNFFFLYYSKTCLQVSIFRTPLKRFIAYCSVSTIH